jgi:hypothetical protein
MKSKDLAIVALAPLGVLLIPLVAMQFTAEVKWTGIDFAVMWVVLAIPTFLFRLLMTRPWKSLMYRTGAGLGLLTGLLMTWVNMAVQIIGDRNPANALYFLAVLLGLIGIGWARLHPAGLARTAFSLAGFTFCIPLLAVLVWPGDFAPGFPKVFGFNCGFVAMFALAGGLLRKAADQTAALGTT